MSNPTTPARPTSARPAPPTRGGAGECVVALDVGGTGMKGALLDRGLTPLASLRRPTPRGRGTERLVGEIADAVGELARQAGPLDRTVAGAGVVVPGIVHEERGRAVYSANLGWRDLPLAALLQARTGLPVTLGHDVRAGGLAELWHGAARGARDVLFLAIGTGIAAALVGDGRVLTGGGYAGEIGHLAAEPDGARCGCGRRGCLETVASARAVADRYRARSGREVQGAAEVAELVVGGDADAQLVWDQAAEALASALATVSTLLAPELVVIGGGLGEADELLLTPVRTHLAERLTFQRRPSLVRAELGDRAGCWGAGLRAWDAMGVSALNAPASGGSSPL